MTRIPQLHSEGCVVASLAMVTGHTYEQIAAYFGNDFNQHGLTSIDAHEYLDHAGFCWVHRHSYMHGNIKRSPWPAPPFAPVHLVCVINGDRSHAVAMDSEGVIFDPLKAGAYSLADFETVPYIIGVFPRKA